MYTIRWLLTFSQRVVYMSLYIKRSVMVASVSAIASFRWFFFTFLCSFFNYFNLSSRRCVADGHIRTKRTTDCRATDHEATREPRNENKNRPSSLSYLIRIIKVVSQLRRLSCRSTFNRILIGCGCRDIIQ